MDAAHEAGYKPPLEFQEDTRDALIELNLTDSTELWLIQWPIKLPLNFDGQEVSLKLHCDGFLGSFEDASGKSYDVVKFAAQDPDATVFSSSASGSNIVGKISRRVSLVHYPELSDLQEHDTNKVKQMYERSSGTSLTNSTHHFPTSTQAIRRRQSQSASGYPASTHGGGRRSSLSGVREPSKAPKRGNLDEPTESLNQLPRGLETVRSASSGSLP